MYKKGQWNCYNKLTIIVVLADLGIWRHASQKPLPPTSLHLHVVSCGSRVSGGRPSTCRYKWTPHPWTKEKGRMVKDTNTEDGPSFIHSLLRFHGYYSEALPTLAWLKRRVLRLEYNVSERIMGSNCWDKGSPFHTEGPTTHRECTGLGCGGTGKRNKE